MPTRLLRRAPLTFAAPFVLHVLMAAFNSSRVGLSASICTPNSGEAWCSPSTCQQIHHDGPPTSSKR